MFRLNERAFQIIKNEIDRCHTDSADAHIERAILISRLETLRTHPGKPMTRVELWEVLSDVTPNFDQNVLMDAESVETDSPLLGMSMGVGAVAMLVSAAIGIDSLMTETASVPAQSAPTLGKTTPQAITVSSTETSANAAAEIGSEKEQPEPKFQQLSPSQKDSLRQLLSLEVEPQALNNRRPTALNSAAIQPFERAREIGWQAALKAQNPPHSAQHWGETAALWRAAIAYLNQVPPGDSNYSAAQLKKSIYQRNLQAIEAQEAAALKRIQRGQNVAQAPASTPSASQSPRFSMQRTGDLAGDLSNLSRDRSEDRLNEAKRYGWQAAVASQNAPHSAETWADISRLWQTALQNLNDIDKAHPRYAEAQRIKVQYQQNLNAIRDRYQQEQTASQRLQSLQATLAELGYPNAAQSAQLASIVEKLKTIPAGTQAYLHAQSLIAEVSNRMGAIATNPTR
jgi:hypothetical protein